MHIHAMMVVFGLLFGAAALSSLSPLVAPSKQCTYRRQHPATLLTTSEPREAVIPRFLPHRQEPAVLVSPYQAVLNVTRDLGANNPSIQFDGTNFHYHFARGDAGWISALEVANTMHIKRIHFPRGTYWFGDYPTVNRSTVVDLSLYPNLHDGLDVYGDGDEVTIFTSWAPTFDGSMLELSAGAGAQSFATMSWKMHGMSFRACAVGFALAVNSPARQHPRAEHNNLQLYDLYVYNELANNTCHGQAFPKLPGQVSINAQGALFAGHIWSSYINVGLATVSTAPSFAPGDSNREDGGDENVAFNSTGGVVLDEVQYSTLSLRGLGAHNPESFSAPDPTKPNWYPGWGLILRANVNSNTVIQLHCEGSGGCVLIQGGGSFENRFTSAVMSMMQRALIVSRSPPPEALSVPNHNVFDGIVVNRYPVRDNATNATHRFSKAVLTEGSPGSLTVQHMSVIGDVDA